MFSLKWQLKRIRNSAQPSRGFRVGLLSQLRLAYGQEYGCPQRRPFFVRVGAVGLVSLLIFFSVGTAVYAYESPDVTEGHPLHFVKTGIEGVQKSLARSPEARAEFHARMMERRIEEGEHQLPARPDRVTPSLDDAADQFEQTISALEQGVEDEAVREELIEHLSIQRARYLELSSRVPDHEGESGEFEPLRKRIEGQGLSEQEILRLFGTGARRIPVGL